MAVVYDKYYQVENLFGEPYPELIEFLSNWIKKGTLLDLGCGQGRDAIPISRMGYKVTGVDNSRVGIEQMNRIASKEKLALKGIVGDIFAFEDFRNFDIVLLDSMFHFNKKDKKRETDFIKELIDKIKNEAFIIFCIQDSGNKVKILKDIVNDTGKVEKMTENEFEYVYEDAETKHKSRTKYKMLVFSK